MELHGRAFRPAVQSRDPGALAHRLDPHDQQQGVHLFRNGAETVDQLCREAFQLDLGGQRRQAAVQAKAQVKVGHIIFRDQHRHAQVDLW